MNTLIGENLKKYLKCLLETELNVYVLETLIYKMTETYNSLGKKKRISEPKLESAEITVIPIVMVIVGLIGGVIAGIWGACVEATDGFWRLLHWVVLFIVYGIVYFFIIGLTAGTVIGLIFYFAEKSRIRREYEAKMEDYYVDGKNDEERVAREKKKAAALLVEINAAKDRLTDAESNLARMYAYNVISYDYRNIYAVSSMYGYVSKGRTRCLAFDPQTGDQGAYNIYENERRLDLIITNTEEIIRRLDTVIDNQYELANGLRQANNTVAKLTNNVNKAVGTLNNIERCQEVVAYNTEQSKKELEFLNWMSVLY